MSVETNPKALKAWLVSLPHGNLNEAGRAIFDSLSTLNRSRLDGDERQKLLEHYQVSIDMLDAPLETVYVSGALPVKDKAKQAATMARNLQLELAIGYKHVLNDRLNSRFSLGAKHVPALIQRLFVTYQKLMWVCCKSYSAVPEGVWLEVHTLFRYAINHKFIDGPDGVLHPINSIGGLYKQMLLLALADPYRYQPSEIDKIQDLIRNYGVAAQFQPLGVASNPAGFFLVRLDVDSAPAFLGQRPMDVQANSAILLDTIEMAKLLHKAQISVENKLQTAPDKGKALSWLDLLRRVTRQWSIAPKRVFQRVRANSRVRIVGGLPSTAHFVNAGKAMLQPVLLDEEMEAEAEDMLQLQTPAPRFPEPDAWVVLNESPGGYALRLKPMPNQGVYRVGDVVGVNAEASEPWMVGIIRWVQTTDSGDALEIGVQVLTPTANAVMLRPTITHASDSFQAALLLPEVAALKQAPMVLGPRGAYASARDLAIFNFHGESIVRATRLVEQTVGFDLFEYDLAPQ